MSIRKRFHWLCLIAALALTSLSVAVALVKADVTPISPVQMTPPAPVFDDAKRLAELTARRQQLADQIGPKAVMVMFSAEPRVYTNDVDFPFRQENNLYYLTSLNQKGATLVMMPGTQLPEILFM